MTWEEIRFFKPSEFADPTLEGSGMRMSLEFVKLLDELREYCGFPLFIASGYRTPEHNKEVGGVDSSAHEKGYAADIAARDSRTRFKILEGALKLGIHRIGVGFSFVHVDIDPDLPPSVAWMYPPGIIRYKV